MVHDLTQMNTKINGKLCLNPSHATKIEADIPAHTTLPQNRKVTSLQDVSLVLCIEDLMAVLCIGRNTAYELVRSGQIRSIKVGKNYRIPRDAVEEFLKK